MTGGAPTAGARSGAGRDVALLQVLLEAEHAAVHGYGTLGGRLADAARTAARTASDAHRARRDSLVARLAERGARAPAALPAYDVVVPDRPSALALAVRLEEGMSGRWLDLVGGAQDPALRALGVSGLQETAVRAASWRRLVGTRPPTVALPGS